MGTLVTTAPAGLGRRGRSFVRASSPGLPGLLQKAAYVAYALGVLARVELGLRRRSLPALCDSLGVRLHDAAPPLQPGDAPWTDLHRAAARGALVLRWWPFPDTCLRRCLLLGAVLRDDDPGLLIGVRRRDDGVIAAHSWLLLGGRSIDPTSDEYAAFRHP